jgi:two-component system cell cycle sensor histidine kinase PleC
MAKVFWFFFSKKNRFLGSPHAQAASSPPALTAKYPRHAPMLAMVATASLLLATLLLAVLLLERRRASGVVRALGVAQARAQELTRLLRLTASDLRAPALSLLGHADQIPAPHKATLVNVCRGLLDTAEAILDQTDDPIAKRYLREEPIAVGPLLDFAVAQVTAQLGPSRRVWRIAPGLENVVLRADRRALHQVFLRVLTGAALATADGDCIDIAATTANAAWCLRIEDEGAGLAVPRVAGAGVESRGLGLGLSLARSLMQAHGGGLALESAPLVGTRALLSFPIGRVLETA